MPHGASPQTAGGELARRQIASEQQALLKALLTGSEPPAGFDIARVNGAGEALRRKRVRTMKRANPRLQTIDEVKLTRHLARYIERYPSCHADGPYRDSRAFLFYLRVGRWLALAGL